MGTLPNMGSHQPRLASLRQFRPIRRDTSDALALQRLADRAELTGSHQGTAGGSSHFGTFVGYLIAALAIPVAIITICRACWIAQQRNGTSAMASLTESNSSSFQTPRRPRSKKERYQSLGTDNDEDREGESGMDGMGEADERGRGGGSALASRGGTSGAQIEMV